ncbi:MAG TPA: carbohydrate-binding protein, partial [Blastocatellia bacterium]|nr:carbohydrate-binding protein [Blastocatellia bacterium]
LVAFNDSSSAQKVQVTWGTQSFAYKLKTFEGATFTWAGSQTGGYQVRAASQQIQASSYSDTSGLESEITSDTGGGYDLGFSSDGDWAVYRHIDFGSGVTSVRIRVASAGNGGNLELHLNSASGPLIGSVVIPVTGGWQTWTTVSGSVSGVSGVSDLYIVFKGTTSIGNVNWLQFKP